MYVYMHSERRRDLGSFLQFRNSCIVLIGSITGLSKCANSYRAGAIMIATGIRRGRADEGVAALRGVLLWWGEVTRRRIRSGLFGGLCAA